jgi:hypothetical protein
MRSCDICVASAVAGRFRQLRPPQPSPWCTIDASHDGASFCPLRSGRSVISRTSSTPDASRVTASCDDACRQALQAFLVLLGGVLVACWVLWRSAWPGLAWPRLGAAVAWYVPPWLPWLRLQAPAPMYMLLLSLPYSSSSSSSGCTSIHPLGVLDFPVHQHLHSCCCCAHGESMPLLGLLLLLAMLCYCYSSCCCRYAHAYVVLF